MTNLRARLAGLGSSDWRWPALLFGLSLVLRLATFAWLFPHPYYADSEYYTSVARELAAGRGFSIPYLWSFIDHGGTIPAIGALPLPSNAHWLPLASLVQVPFIWLIGATDFASAAPFIILGALLAPFSYLFVRDMFGAANARFAGLAALIPGWIAGYLVEADNFALFGLLVAGACWLVGRRLGGRAGARSMAVAGILVGLAFLARTDGTIVAGALALVLLWQRRRVPLRETALLGLTAFAVALPWLVRQVVTFGQMFPSAVSGRILWIIDANEMFGADGPLGPDHLLSRGLGALLQTRVDAAISVALLLALGLAGLGLVPFIVAGLKDHGRRLELLPFTGFGVVLVVWSVVFAALHVASGNMLHTGVSLIPFMYGLAAAGRAPLFAFVARHRPRWNAAGGARRWSFAVLGTLYAGALAGGLNHAGAYAEQRILLEDGVAWLTDHARPGTCVMSVDPGQVWLLGEFPGMQTPTGDPAVVGRAARAFGMEYLFLHSTVVAPGLNDVFLGREQPDWLSPPVYSVDAGQDPLVRIYRILPGPDPAVDHGLCSPPAGA